MCHVIYLIWKIAFLFLRASTILNMIFFSFIYHVFELSQNFIYLKTINIKAIYFFVSIFNKDFNGQYFGL